MPALSKALKRVVVYFNRIFFTALRRIHLFGEMNRS